MVYAILDVILVCDVNKWLSLNLLFYICQQNKFLWQFDL